MLQIPTDLTEAAMKQWLKDYPVPIEDFGKDWVNQFHSLLGYKTDHESVVALRQTLNVTRQILLDGTHGTFDVLADNRKETLIVVEEDNGERWEDYHKWVQKVYKVRTNKSADDLILEWKTYIVEVLATNNIVVSVNWPHNMDMNVQDLAGRTKSNVRKTHKRIVRENDFCHWLKNNYNAVEQPFQVAHP